MFRKVMHTEGYIIPTSVSMSMTITICVFYSLQIGQTHESCWSPVVKLSGVLEPWTSKISLTFFSLPDKITTTRGLKRIIVRRNGKNTIMVVVRVIVKSHVQHSYWVRSKLQDPMSICICIGYFATVPNWTYAKGTQTGRNRPCLILWNLE